MKIHLAILTYNALAYTQRCLQSLLTHTSLPIDVQVVDNASTDGTQAWLAGITDPRIRVHESSVNLGVPGGRNELLRQILPRAADEDFVVFLDNDIELHPGWHEPFERLFATQPRAGMASKVGWTMQVRGDTRDPQTAPWETARVDIVAGGFACWTRVQALREVGLQDENLGLFWHEDDDWALRFTGAGWSIWAVPEAQMTHHEHASGVAWPTLENGDSQRNLAYLTDKWRRLGLVDEAGWVRDCDPLFCPSMEVREEMRQRLGRLEPLSRGEYVQCYWDLHALLCTQEQGRIFPRPVSPGLSVLLDLLCEGDLLASSPEVHQRYLSLARTLQGIDALRPGALACDPMHGRSEAPLHGVARCDSWDDPRWLGAYHELKGSASTASWFDRSAADWAKTTALVSLDEAGLLGAGKRGLILDPRDVELACALVDRGTEVLLCGHFDIASEAMGGLPPEFVSHPERWLGDRAEGLRFCRPQELPAEAGFDFVFARAGLWGDSEDPVMLERLSSLERHVAPGGHAYLHFDCVVGDRDSGSLEPLAWVGGLMARPGFVGVTDPGLLAACAPPVRNGHAPELSIRNGEAFETQGLVCYERPQDLSLCRPVPGHIGQSQVLVDLRGMLLDGGGLPDAAREGIAAVRSALPAAGDSRLILLGDGDCPSVLRALLAHRDVCYRSAASICEPDLILYLEGPRWLAPRLEPDWRHKPVLAFHSSLSRESLRQGQDRGQALAYLQFVQQEATHLLVSGLLEEAPLRAVFDPGQLQLVSLARTCATLQPSPVSCAEVLAITGLGPRYLLLEGSVGARERVTEILASLQKEIEQQDLLLVAMGAEFVGLESIVRQGSHPLFARLRFLSQVPEPLRRPLLAGARGLVVAAHPWEFRLGADEAASIGVPVRDLGQALPQQERHCAHEQACAIEPVDLATVLREVLMESCEPAQVVRGLGERSGLSRS